MYVLARLIFPVPTAWMIHRQSCLLGGVVGELLDRLDPLSAAIQSAVVVCLHSG